MQENGLERLFRVVGEALGIALGKIGEGVVIAMSWHEEAVKATIRADYVPDWSGVEIEIDSDEAEVMALDFDHTYISSRIREYDDAESLARIMADAWRESRENERS